MDRSKVKIIINEWVRIETDKSTLETERKKIVKEINQKYKNKQKTLDEQQEQLANPILQLMNQVDTECIDISDTHELKSKPVTKTTGLTKAHIKARLDDYYNISRNNYATMLSQFCRENDVDVTYEELLSFLNKTNINYEKILRIFIDRYNVKVKEDKINDFLTEHLTSESTQVFEYIIDMAARKEYLEEEVLKLTKKRGKNKKKS